MLNHSLEALIEQLASARRDVRQLPGLPTDLVPVTSEDGYAVNKRVAERLGWEPLGWKIAGTTTFVQQKLGLDCPIYGRTFKRFEVQSPTTFRTSDLLDPLIECEFFVRLKADLPPRETSWTMPEVIEAIETVQAGIEIAECRFPTALMPPLPAVLADGSASGRYVCGPVIEKWAEGLADTGVILEVDGVVKRRGAGRDVMGNPLTPLVWLVNERSRSGDGLRAGELISTGSMTGMLPVRQAKSVKAIFASAHVVEIDFDG